ncbi:L-carnitine dehydrogenase [Roseovarius albus]|uniref:L-carnitine dehydrogenase n=1 Tax=Roseovarius albus TaxID=1247867 RepID=A0A1X6ZBQ8_9RHOB|nr:thioesterase family protein [Roseovarius albus]SLN44925.1 L-carnitine dehydrogenase [Roseovarius albus]
MFERDWVCTDLQTVPKEWIDYNDHMNMAYYVMVFDTGLDEILDRKLGAGQSYTEASGQGPFVVQNHVHYIGELVEGDQFYCQYLLLAGDAKRVHIAGEMHKQSDGGLVCVMEQVLINVDHATRRSTPYPQDIQERIKELVAAHAEIPRPTQLGCSIGLHRQ